MSEEEELTEQQKREIRYDLWKIFKEQIYLSDNRGDPENTAMVEVFEKAELRVLTDLLENDLGGHKVDEDD